MKTQSGRRDSNPRPQPWQGCALPTELLPLVANTRKIKEVESGFEPLYELLQSSA
jgi:hypothetical protein